MSKFLDDLFDNLEQPENDQADEVAEDIVEVEQPDDEPEGTTEDDGGEAEEVEEVEEPEEASKESEAEDDDDTELTPAERKAYGRLKALQDERTKRQSADEARRAAEAERDRLNEQLAEMQRQQREAAAQINLPDAYEDPQGYIAAREAQFQEQLTRQQLGNSIARAVERHGEADVQAAATWFEGQIASNPSIPLRENMLSQADQMEYVLSSYKQSQRVNAFASGDYSALVAELQKAGYNIQRTETTPSAEAPIVKAPANIASPAPTAPAAPKRSKLAGTAGTTIAAPKYASKLDTFIRR